MGDLTDGIMGYNLTVQSSLAKNFYGKLSLKKLAQVTIIATVRRLPELKETLLKLQYVTVIKTKLLYFCSYENCLYPDCIE